MIPTPDMHIRAPTNFHIYYFILQNDTWTLIQLTSSMFCFTGQMESRCVKLDHSYAKSPSKLFQYIHVEHNYAKPISNTFPKITKYIEIEHNYAKHISNITTAHRRNLQNRYYKMQKSNQNQHSDNTGVICKVDNLKLLKTPKSEINDNVNDIENSITVSQDTIASNLQHSDASLNTIASDHAYAKSPPKLFTHYNEIGESNIKLDKTKILQIEMVCQKLKRVRPSSVCCICGKILYPSSEYWLTDFPLHEQRARKIVPEISHVNIANREK